ncbi:MAG: M20/M25/M40 family metallo-hydrolase [Anaerolineales bacterium]
MKRILSIFFLLTLVLSGCRGAVVSPSPSNVAANSAVATLAPLGTPAPRYGDIARALIRDLTNIGPRVAGSPAETQTAQYIASVFKALGYSPETQPFTASAGNTTIKSANVVAVKTGASKQEIIVGAHYDSTADGPGADDNASGVGVMLEVAKLLAGKSTPYTIRFIAFGAEENGLLGSYAYLNQMSQAEFENTIVMIDLDSLVAGDNAYVYSDEGQSSVRDWALDWALGNGLVLQTIRNADLTDPATGKGSSDYAAFRDAGIPYAYFETTDWSIGDKKGHTQVNTTYGVNGVIRHTKYDTLAYLDATFPGRVDQHLNLFITILYALLTQYEVPIR